MVWLAQLVWCRSFFGLWFYASDNIVFSLVAMTFAGAILGFLFFNWQPSKFLWATPEL